MVLDAKQHYALSPLPALTAAYSGLPLGSRGFFKGGFSFLFFYFKKRQPFFPGTRPELGTNFFGAFGAEPN
jgi:hypothetical protein